MFDWKQEVLIHKLQSRRSEKMVRAVFLGFLLSNASAWVVSSATTRRLPTMLTDTHHMMVSSIAGATATMAAPTNGTNDVTRWVEETVNTAASSNPVDRKNSPQSAYEYKPANAWTAFVEGFDMFFPEGEKYGAMHDLFLKESGGVWKAKAFGLFEFYGVSAIAPGLTKDLMKADAQGKLQNAWAFNLDEILGDSTFTIVADRQDPKYLEARNIYVDQLSTNTILSNDQQLSGLEHQIDKVMTEWEQAAAQDKPIVFAEGVGNMTFGFLMNILLGSNGSNGSKESLFTQEEAAIIHSCVRTVNAGLFCPPMDNWFVRKIPYFNRYAKGLKARRTITNMVEAAVERRSEALVSGSPSSGMLDALIGANLPTDQIVPFAVENMVLSFLAGYETTTSLLCNAALILADNNESQETLLHELEDLDLRDPSLYAKKGLFRVLPTLESVMSESFRYRPVANGHFRKAKDDVTLGDVTIPKGSTITWLQSPGMQSKTLYTDPAKACPLRFLQHNKNRSSKPEPLPELFGYGKHICPGRFLAQIQMALLMKAFLSRFEFSLVSKQDLRPNMPNMVPKSGLIMQLNSRKRQQPEP